MSEQPGILRCSICGYVGAFYIPCVCSRCMEKHHAVVDAAMARYRLGLKAQGLPASDPLWTGWHKTGVVEDDACRKYEEQTHGPCQCCERIGEKPLPTADSLEWQCDCACHFTGEVEHG